MIPNRRRDIPARTLNGIDDIPRWERKKRDTLTPKQLAKATEYISKMPKDKMFWITAGDATRQLMSKVDDAQEMFLDEFNEPYYLALPISIQDSLWREWRKLIAIQNKLVDISQKMYSKA
jgi:hypothetical protein